MIVKGHVHFWEAVKACMNDPTLVASHPSWPYMHITWLAGGSIGTMVIETDKGDIETLTVSSEMVDNEWILSRDNRSQWK